MRFVARQTRPATRGRSPSCMFRPHLEMLENRRLLTAGALDAAFGAGGLVTTAFGRATLDAAYGVALQTDGRIIAVGEANGQFAVARYGLDGVLDTTFGGGKVMTNMGGGAAAWDVAIYANGGANDGKIVVAGAAGLSGLNNHGFGVTRYNRDGSLDKTFNKSGKATVDFSSGWDAAHAVAIQPDGKIIAAGYSSEGPTLVRFNANGTLDTLFGNGGKVITDVGLNGGGVIQDVVLQSDGKIIAAGTALVRYESNGRLDASFGNGGIVLSPNGGGSFVGAEAVMIQPDGMIITAGTVQPTDSVQQFGLMRFNATGTLDSNFGTDGVAPGGADTEGELRDAVLQPDGKIVTAGEFQLASGNRAFALARFNTDGTLDSSFDDDGKVVTDTASYDDEFWGVALQADGKIVAAGATLKGSGYDYDFALARYLGDPPLRAASASPHIQSGTITASEAQPLLAEARVRWQAAGVDTSALGSIQIQIANLCGTTLGLASGNTIWLDDNAAGWGWFVDATPSDDSEFVLPGNQGEKDRIDLLTVVMHELGHLFGRDHDEEGVMAEKLADGVRRTELEHDDVAHVDQLLEQASDPHNFAWLGAWLKEQFDSAHGRAKRRR